MALKKIQELYFMVVDDMPNMRRTIKNMLQRMGVKKPIIEADDGDYLVKGKDLSKMVGKMVEVTGIITESDTGDVIEVKSYEEIQE